MSSPVLGMNPVDRNGALDAPPEKSRPEAIPLLIIATDKFGEIARYFCLKE